MLKRVKKKLSFTSLKTCKIANNRYKSIYTDMAACISKVNSEADLMWWRQNNGPDMPMNWPQFEVSLFHF